MSGAHKACCAAERALSGSGMKKLSLLVSGQAGRLAGG